MVSLVSSLKKAASGALICVRWNMRMLLKNVRFFLGLLMGFGICFFLTEKVVYFSRFMGTDLQIFEPFIWCFGDSDSVLFASLALLLPLSQIPRLDASASYLIFRTGRKSWVAGQLITVLLVSVFYTVFLLAASCLMSLGRVFTENRWSDTATAMSYAPVYIKTAITMVRRTVRQFTPYECVSMVFFLLLQYMVFLSMMNLTVSLIFGKKAGLQTVMGLSFIFCFLSPDRFMDWLKLNKNLAYVANLISAWISPLQHATYAMHSNGYDHLPGIEVSHALFTGLNLILLFLSFCFSQRITFIFRRGEEDS